MKHGIVVIILTLVINTPLMAFETNPEIERGHYLVRDMLSCTHCHGEDLGGAEGVQVAGITSNAPNITDDEDTGIGGWTDKQVSQSIRNGIRPDGSYIGAPMPVNTYKNISDDDLKAIVAYLRSLPLVNRTIKPSEMTVKSRKQHGPVIDKVPAPDGQDPVAKGKYVYELIYCSLCHNAFQNNELYVGVGGNPFKQPDGSVVISSNLTPSGNLPGYSDEELKKVIKYGVRPDGSKLRPPMPTEIYHNVADTDLNDLIDFLRSLPAGEAPSPAAN
ncbi:c-type cytochrome [Thalassotalea mangrovi]|uniref:Cytochrome c n=1 Tax=Thalassotalea mangrovi TaxID=2572245 RepID=A0A4U1B637_9GAMM|nr:cytochrome c [Thalassotalea mangrovi]TKB45598.1 cytochrome c [Thalassotalea mangrovi]